MCNNLLMYRFKNHNISKMLMGRNYYDGKTNKKQMEVGYDRQGKV